MEERKEGVRDLDPRTYIVRLVTELSTRKVKGLTLSPFFSFLARKGGLLTVELRSHSASLPPFSGLEMLPHFPARADGGCSGRGGVSHSSTSGLVRHCC
jgi:hypothetical protein